MMITVIPIDISVKSWLRSRIVICDYAARLRRDCRVNYKQQSRINLRAELLRNDVILQIIRTIN